jgi:drug/metabolite transporter (DMT)-like permease
MRLFLLTALTMVAFAANSLLNRAGVHGAGFDALWFGVVRLWSGALVLAVLVLMLRGGLRLGGRGRLVAVSGLVLYIFGFSLAYVRLDAGLGALILFGTVQITMFAGSLALGERPPALRWLGAALAFGGLCWLLWPREALDVSLSQAMVMVVAGVGWGGYSLAGRSADDPLTATAANFLLAAPVGLVLTLALPAIGEVDITWGGLALAVISGGLTSGLGYALWYHVLSQLPGTSAAVAQLTVPVIAIAGGALFLGEALGLQLVLAAVVVLGGVALSVLGNAR